MCDSSFSSETSSTMSNSGKFSTLPILPKVLVSFLICASTITLLTLPLLFIYLNNVQESYLVDEVFHIPQALKYCKGQFNEWDDKITTLPGLYLLSYLVLGPLNLCETIYLRSINLICTYINFFLILKLVIFLKKQSRNDNDDWWKEYLTASNIAFFPTLFFFFFLYYTDVLSTTTVFVMLWFHIKRNFVLSATAGAAAVLVRQTNIVWVGLFAFEQGINVISKLAGRSLTSNNVLECIKSAHKNIKTQREQGLVPLFKFVFQSFISIIPYAAVILSFLVFVIYNKGIVVGDRTAHSVTLHVPQIFYFTTFTFIFAWPYMLPQVWGFLKFIIKHRILSSTTFCLIVLAIHYNTLEHPYLLADNRHYSFYLWKNFMRRYEVFRYLMAPVYGFTIYAFMNLTKHVTALIRMVYFTCVMAVLVPQLLLEPRYFIIPYLLFRLTIRNVSTLQIIEESFTLLAINVFQFQLFVNKFFYWKDIDAPQRITW